MYDETLDGKNREYWEEKGQERKPQFKIKLQRHLQNVTTIKVRSRSIHLYLITSRNSHNDYFFTWYFEILLLTG